MIPPLAAWTWEPDGTTVHLHPRAPALAGAALVYTEKLRPAYTVGEVADAVIAARGLHGVVRGEVARVVTVEGEHAEVLAITGVANGAPLHVTIASVLADDYASLLVGTAPLAAAAAIDALVRRTIVDDRHYLGVRRRRFAYQPPAGWSGDAVGLYERWSPPDDPSALLVVAPALPRGACDAEELLLDALACVGLEVAGACATGALVARCGLAIEHRAVAARAADGATCEVYAVVASDERYVYPLVLYTGATGAAAALAALAATCDAIEPLPGPPRPSTHHLALAHWGE